jgi:Ca-activated chloride channel homolog
MQIPYFPDYQLASPWWLLLLPLVPFLALLRGRKGQSAAMAFPMIGLMQGLGSPTRNRAGGFMANLLFLSLALAIVGMARPQKIISYDEEKTEGIAICVAVDVSLSMRIEDFFLGGQRVNRLSIAKRVLIDFIKGRPHDRIGIVAFSGAPYNPCPPTLDHDWLLQNMDRIRTGVMEDGTAIGSGIAAAARRLDGQEVKSKVLVLLTDGANNSGKLSPTDAARLAATLGIRIYTVGVGTPGNHRIPLENGQVINSGRDEFDEASLKEIATIGNGAFFKAEDTDSLQRIFKTIDAMEKTEVKHQKIVETEEEFPWVVIPAAIFALLHLLWRQTLGRTSPVVA